jgi:hypothetical protein
MSKCSQDRQEEIECLSLEGLILTICIYFDIVLCTFNDLRNICQSTKYCLLDFDVPTRSLDIEKSASIEGLMAKMTETVVIKKKTKNIHLSQA